ncbi:MAG: type IV pilus twitching motility protein PilT, partial [Bacillota bacterium]|nr:type IV pilus twitching motility protein PilT [Bacillota bacterium]
MQITDLMKLAVEKNASDIFLTVGVPPVFKIDSGFELYGDKIMMKSDTEEMIKQLFTDEERYATFLKKGEMDFSFSSPGVGRFRVDVYIQRNSHAAAIRVLKFDILDTAKLRIPDEVLSVRNSSKGLVLVTGPTGSGKSTTLACIIDRINSEREAHILTLEDPIEFIHKHKKSIVNQREIGIDTASYQEGLRASMRQSPDVILIGEMRDYETMSIAMTAAETGHLVLSTLHTVGGAKTVDRVIDVFPSNQQDQIRIQLSTVLKAVVSQQLIPRIGGGRVPAFEIMIVNHAIRNLIREGKIPQIEAAIHSGRAEGMISMDYSIARLLKEGLITEEDAFHYCINPDTLQR